MATWLMGEDELKIQINDCAESYFGSDGHIFNRPYGAGYWLQGVEYHPQRGWLAFEFDDDDPQETNHKEAVNAWRKGAEVLPKGYFALTCDVVEQVLKNAIRRYGEQWLEGSVDLPSMEEALQWTLLREIRYA